MTIVSEAKSSN